MRGIFTLLMIALFVTFEARAGGPTYTSGITVSNAIAAVSTAYSHNGVQSYMVTGGGSASPDINITVNTITEWTTIVKATVWVYSTSSWNSGQLYVNSASGTDGIGWKSTAFSVTTTGTWQLLTYDFSAYPYGSTDSWGQFGIQYFNKSDVLYLDDITFYNSSGDVVYQIDASDVSIAPTVTTQAVSSIATTTVTGNGNITALGTSNPTAYGVCWNTTGTPTTSDSKDDKGAASATCAFTSNITGLTSGTTYYVRAYAINTVGTSYGNEVSFTTDGIITYYLNGGTNNVANTSTYIYGVGLTLSTPTKAGYTFGGWYDNASFIGTAQTAISTSAIGDVTLYAKWTVNTYNITYELNGGTNDAANVATYTYGVGLTLSPPTQAGYIFGGWYDNASFIGTAITAISTSAIGDVRLYAKWAKIYTITSTAGDGGSVSPSGEIRVNEGSSQSFTISVNSGYHIADVLVDGSSVGTVSSYSFSDVTANHTIVVSFALTTGIDNTVAKAIGIYPNPVNNILHVNNASGTTLKVYNAMGNALLQKKLTSNDETINVSSLPTGWYLLQLGNTRIKVVKE